MPETAVLFSGGLDSAVLLAEEAQSAVTHPLYVSTGLAWEPVERAIATRLLAAPVFAGRVHPLVALDFTVRDLYSLPLDDIALARAAQRAENEFVGAPVGIMDQMACLLADEHAALFLDTRDLTFERIQVPDAAGLVVIHSGISHRHAGGDYATRRRECGEAGALLHVATLRDLTDADTERIERLPSPLNRRALHVLTENNRVLATVEALRDGDLGGAGRLFVESHASLRDDYEVSVPEVDVLAQSLATLEGSYGARITGGGFGGSVVALTDAGDASRIAEQAAETYRRATGIQARIMVPA